MKYKTWTEIDYECNPTFVHCMTCPICKQNDFTKQEGNIGCWQVDYYTCTTCGNVQMFDADYTFIEEMDDKN